MSWQWITSGRLPAFHMNSTVPLGKDANLAVRCPSGEPYKWPRPKNWSGECGSMKRRHFLPCTNPNHTVQCTNPLYQGYCQLSNPRAIFAGSLPDSPGRV